MERITDIAVIIPVSERHDDLRELHAAYAGSLAGFTAEYCYIIDGYFPEAEEQVRELLDMHDNVSAYQLARSFGEATALQVGIEHTASGVLLTLPAYFQVEVEALPQVLQQLAECDMAIGRRFPRVDSWINRVQARLFHWGVSWLTGKSFRDLGCGVRAFRRALIPDLPFYGDQHRFLPVMASRRGYQVCEVNLAQSRRDPYRRVYAAGIYARRLLDVLTIFFLFKFTQKPLRFFGLVGCGMSFIGGVIITMLILQRMFFEIPMGNRPALLLSALLVVLGVQLLALGLVGELLIFIHARNMKEYTVRKIIN